MRIPVIQAGQVYIALHNMLTTLQMRTLRCFLFYSIFFFFGL